MQQRMSDKTISVIWPPLALNDAGWLQRLDELATQAEELVGKPVTLQQTAELGLQLIGLVWPALSPETIAASCRASALLGVPVVMSTAPADQVQEVAERLDAIYAAAQSDPSAALVELAAPMLQHVIPESKQPGRPKRVKTDHPIEVVGGVKPGGIIDSCSWQVSIKSSAQLLAKSPDPVMADHPVEPPAPAPEPEPPTPPAPAAEVPAEWLLAADVAELLNISVVTVSRWRLDGHLGAEGQAWLPSGRSYAFEPGMIELLMDQLAARKQVNSKRNRPRVGDQRPAGWLTCDEFAKAAGCSGSKARELVRYGEIPAEMVLRIGRRSQWIDPAAVELWRSGDVPATQNH